MYHPHLTRPGLGTIGQLDAYNTLAAFMAAVLVVLILTLRAITVPLSFAALTAERLTGWLDRRLASVPPRPQPARATATRLPTTPPRSG